MTVEDNLSTAPRGTIDQHLHPPREQLDPKARTMWYVSEVIQLVPWAVMIGAIAWVLVRFTDLPERWVIGIAALLVIGNAVESVISPGLRYRHWRYEIRDDEVDLQHGFMVRTRQLVPMSRIQHVDTRRGPLQRRFGLSSVVFYTAAGAMEIPALSQEVAADVRNKIAALAKVHDDL